MHEQSTTVEERTPIIDRDEVGQEEQLFFTGRSHRRSRGVGLLGGLAFAGCAIGALVGSGGIGRFGGASSRVARRGEFLADKASADVVGSANMLSQSADMANAAFQEDRDKVKALEEKAQDESATGEANIKKATGDLADAESDHEKALEAKKKAEEELQRAQAAIEDAKSRSAQAKALNQTGEGSVQDAANLKGQANDIKGRFPEEATAATAAVKKEKEALEDEAQYYADQAAAHKDAADKQMKEAQGKLDAANDRIKTANDTLQEALHKSSDAAAKAQEARDTIVASDSIVATSKATIASANSSHLQGAKSLADGKALASQAKDDQKKVDEEAAKVSDLEMQSEAKSEAHRLCVDITGAVLRNPDKEVAFDPLAVKKDVGTAEACSKWCLDHEGCEQSVFIKWTTSCYLFDKVTEEVDHWDQGGSSSFCGDKSQKDDLEKLKKGALAQKPDVGEPGVCAWSGDDCSETKCCNEVSCEWDLKGCKAFSCYQTGGVGGSCMPTEPWNTGVIIGGGRQVSKIPVAAEGTTRQRTSLFCFMVVNWKTKEGEVATNIKEKKVGIYQCDAHTILTGWETKKTPWSTYINADAFTKLWAQIKDDGTYLQHDWTVKVDADTVWFPNVVRMHLDGLKVPQGSRAYVRNLNFKFSFNGAIEVFTREAVQLYFQNSDVCASKIIKTNEKAGEDFFMKTCMEAAGVGYLEDFNMLRDHSCGSDCGAPEGPCSDGWVAAYHFYRDADSWNKCYDEAIKAQLAAGHKASDGQVIDLSPVKAEQLPAVSGSDATEAKDLHSQASALNDQLEPHEKAADQKTKAAKDQIADAQKQIKDAEAMTAGATKNISDAEDAKADAEKVVTTEDAKKTEEDDIATKASADKASAEQDAAVAQDLVSKAKVAEEKVAEDHGNAVKAEKKERDDIGSQRFCMDLPGVRLKGDEPIKEDPIAMEIDSSTPETCRDWCRDHFKCRQSVFSSSNKACFLFDTSLAEPKEFTQGFNSSYCGMWDDEEDMKAMVDSVYKMMPYVPAAPQCSWAGEDCSQSKCCSNVPIPNWKFTEFEWYTCYKQDESFSGCKTGPAPGNWDGTVLGHMGTREVPKAPEGVLIQGTSLFCFCVVMWNHPATKAFWSSEAELANNIKKTGRSIMQCDDHAFFQGGELNGGGDASSINNIDSFIGAWKQVKDDGRYLHHDWTIKVDSDAVFFPDRLRLHIQSLRTPQGSRVYLRNIDFKFEFLGALEVMSKEALIHYYERSWECEGKVGHQGGEDYYMMACMDGIGIDHQTDHSLLNDKYAATGNCNDPWVVAFHFYKKVTSWNACHDAAVQSAKINGKDWWKDE